MPSTPSSSWYITSNHPPVGPRAIVYVDALTPAEKDQVAWLDNLVRDYPGAKGAQLRSGGLPSFEEISEGRFEVRIEWPIEDGAQSMSNVELEQFFDKRAPKYRYQHQRYLRPSFETSGSRPPTPLMTWWLLLYSFSMLSRYQPRIWSNLLNVDKSKYAVALQFALESALMAIPQLVLEALDCRLHLLPLPMSLS